MRTVYLIKWQKIGQISDQTAEELLNLPASHTTIPVYMDEELYNSLSKTAQKELKQLKKYMENGEVLELVVANKE